MSGTNGQAARTAADSLSRIEQWARRAFFAGIACALLLAAIAGVIVNLAIDYQKAKNAMAEASRQMSEDMKTRFPINAKGLR